MGEAETCNQQMINNFAWLTQYFELDYQNSCPLMFFQLTNPLIPAALIWI